MHIAQATSQEATAFAEYLIRIGNGTKPTIENDLIRLPDKIIINSRDDKDNISTLLEAVYPNLTENAIDIKFITERAILTLLNCDIDRINKQIVENFLGEQCTYYSFNTLPDDNLNLYPIEYLNSLMPQELPLHELILKVGAPVMLLRNLDPDNSLCNGMKLICHGLQTYMIDTEIVTGTYRNKHVFIPRLPLLPSEDSRLPFTLERKQFSICLAFALTINKSQDQMLLYIALYLPQSVFSYGQLYVAMSWVHEIRNLKAFVINGRIHRRDSVYTQNVVFREALEL